eukprot:701841_1
MRGKHIAAILLGLPIVVFSQLSSSTEPDLTIEDNADELNDFLDDVVELVETDDLDVDEAVQLLDSLGDAMEESDPEDDVDLEGGAYRNKMRAAEKRQIQRDIRRQRTNPNRSEWEEFRERERKIRQSIRRNSPRTDPYT